MTGRLGRAAVATTGLLLLAAGAFGMGAALAPDHPAVRAAVEGLAGAEPALRLPADTTDVALAWLTRSAVRLTLLPVGALILVAALLPGRRSRFDGELGDAALAQLPDATPDARARKKAKKSAAALAKKGDLMGAADLCIAEGLLDDAVEHLLASGDFVRAAELRRDQKRLDESAELYLKAEKFDSAAGIYARIENWARAAECYARAGNSTVAAEAYEKAGDYRHAAECYAEAGFLRDAARAFRSCDEHERAATCLEQLILEETTGGGDRGRGDEVDSLVRMCGHLYERAEMPEKALAVLIRGERFLDAGDLAMKQARYAEASDLFVKARSLERAAAALEKSGDAAGAARILAEFHRDRGELAESAGCFETSDDWMEAGDLYRLLEDYANAARCYERHGDPAQAAEMYQAVGDRAGAGRAYESAGLFAEAAECYALAGDTSREAELLQKAGRNLGAGEAHHRDGRNDEAIAVLQQVEAGDPDFTRACALLGKLFAARGDTSLARTTLEQALAAGEPVSRDNVDVHYTLATLLESDGELPRAVSLYEKILAFDYGHQDVETRLVAAREAAAKHAASSAASEPDTQAPGRYRIVGKLGRGGMGIVYKAEDSVLDRTVAFKVLPDALQENPQALKNFLREAKSAAQLHHPGIVTVFDAGEQDGAYFIAMEYVDGTTLKAIVKRRGRISAGGIVHVLSQMCDALAFAHDKRVVHRDIKTANTMWTRDKKAKIMDFGLAKVLEEVRNHTTVVSGTPYYMSPEQTLGKNVDHRTDIYSLGVSIFEMATATLPFTEGNIPYHHVHTEPPDPREICPDLPPLLANIIARCLRKDPDERYGSTREILAELKQSLSG